MSLRVAWVAVALLGVIGCGQKGPLYLPEHTGGAVVTRPGAGAQNTGAARATQQPATGSATAPTTQTNGTATPPAQVPANAPSTTPSATKKDSGKDDDSSQK